MTMMTMSCFVYPMLRGELRQAFKSIFPVVNVIVLQLSVISHTPFIGGMISNLI